MRPIVKAICIASTLLLFHCGTDNQADHSAERVLTGTVAIGEAVDYALVTVIDQSSEIATTQTDADGQFTVSLAELSTPPFLLKVDLPNGQSLFSIARGPGVANIHPISDMITRLAYREQGSNIENAFLDPIEVPAPTAVSIEQLEKLVLSELSNPLQKTGVDPVTFNSFTTPFSANHKGFDRLLDTLTFGKDASENPVISFEAGELGELTEITLQRAIPIRNKSNFPPSKEKVVVSKVVTKKDLPVFSKSTLKANPPAKVGVGDTITFQITYTNTGKVGATEVVVENIANKRLIDLKFATGPGSVDGNKVSWRIGSVPAGTGGTVEFSAKVGTSTSKAAIKNRATIVSKENSKETKTNTTSHKVTVPVTYELNVKKAGKGAGGITSDPAGIDCGKVCTKSFTTKGTKVTLTAAPDDKSVFARWGAPCAGKDLSVSVTLNKNMTCIATFNIKPVNPETFALMMGDVNNDLGNGTVTVNPSRGVGGTVCIAIYSFCEAYPKGTPVVLTAKPDEGWEFDSWTGDCASSSEIVEESEECTLTMDKSKVVDAKFIESGNGLNKVSGAR